MTETGSACVSSSTKSSTHTQPTPSTPIMEIVPGADQCISYGMPAFKVKGKTVAGIRCVQKPSELHAPQRVRARNAPRRHRSLRDIEGSLKFGIDKPLLKRLVKKLVSARLRELGSRPNHSDAPDLPIGASVTRTERA